MKSPSETSGREQLSGVEPQAGAAGSATESEMAMERSDSPPAKRARSQQAREHCEEVENEIFFLAASPAMQKIRTQQRQDVP
jgi:hypothetical protein